MSSRPRHPPVLADCHLHFEGSLPIEVVARLASREGHAFADEKTFGERRRAATSASAFLSLYAEVCRLWRSAQDCEEAAKQLSLHLPQAGVGYAEIYVSPEIFARMGLPASECVAAVDAGFAAGRGAEGAECRMLLDAVRQWGPESAHRVLDLYEKSPASSIVGFGIGGDESAVRPSAFSGVYSRARALGLKTSIHAGEWGGHEALAEALDALRPDRVDHGIAAAGDEPLLRRLAGEGTILCVALSSNVATGAVSDFESHPLRRLVQAGVRVALSADDPLLFDCSTAGEYRLARERLGFGEAELLALAENSWHAAFCEERRKREGLAALKLKSAALALGTA